MKLVNLKLSQLQPVEELVETKLCREEISAIQKSVETDGIYCPLVVVDADERYWLIDGRKRARALEELGKKTAPCVIVKGDPKTVFLMHSKAGG